MTSQQIARYRLINQQIRETGFNEPADLIGWMGCLQAQDFAGAKWAIGNRIPTVTNADLDRLFEKGRILRTHVLRPTWHFVTPEDIGWMLTLSAPRIKAFNKSLHKKLGIDETILKRSKTIIVRALSGGHQLTREQLLLLLRKARINTDDIRSNFLMMDAELDRIICSGGRQGKQFTYALFEDRVPVIPYMGDEAAIAELAIRYFCSRGPATLQDFAWWGGLSLSNAKLGLAMNKQRLANQVVNGQAYWFAGDMPLSRQPGPSVHLLPAFDEYMVAYRDRTDILPAKHHRQAGNGIFKPTLLINGQIAGTWKRTEKKDNVIVELNPFSPLGKACGQSVIAAATRYARFLGKSSAGISLFS